MKKELNQTEMRRFISDRHAVHAGRMSKEGFVSKYIEYLKARPWMLKKYT